MSRQPSHERASRIRQARWVRGTSERGATTIEMVLLLPVLFGIVFLGLQAALYYYAATVAGAAAQDGARVAAAHGGGGLGAGTAAAWSALDQSHGSLSNYQVTGSAGTGGPSMTVTGETLSVLPGMVFTVTRSASLPWEQPS